MSIKIKSKQIYEDYEETYEEEYTDYEIKFLDKNTVINYNGNEINYDEEKNKIEIKRSENNISVELKKENLITYKTPYGETTIKTIGEKILIEEKSPLNLVIEYKILLGNLVEYKNIIEILEI